MAGYEAKASEVAAQRARLPRWRGDSYSERRPSMIARALSSAAAVTATTSIEAGRPRHAIRPADAALAKRMVLTRPDFPAGWRASPSAERNDAPGWVHPDFTDRSDLTLTGRAQSPDFEMGDSTVATSVAALFQGTGEARDAFGRIATEKTVRCLAAAIKQEVANGLRGEDVKVGDLSVWRLSFASLGDRSVGCQIVLPLQTTDASLGYVFDVVLVQGGRANAALVFGNFLESFDRGLEHSLSKAVAARMPAAYDEY